MIEIRSATLNTDGIEARLRNTMSEPVEIESAIRDEAARWAPPEFVPASLYT